MRSELETALAAAEAGLRVANARVDAERIIAKGGLDLATGADVSAERAMRHVLERGGSLPVVGEEEGGHAPADGPYWLIDPICGTRNYASHLPLFCCNVALVEDGRVSLAAVGDGVSHELHFAERGHGAFGRTADGSSRRLSAAPCPVLGLDLAGTPLFSGSPAALGALVAAIMSGQKWYLRLLGTSLSLARVATGDLGGLLLLGRVPSPLHTAAGCLLAEEAGAIVTDTDGRPWDLSTTAFVVGATREVHRDLVGLTQEFFGTAA